MSKCTLLNAVTVVAALAGAPAFGLVIDGGAVLPGPSNQVVDPTLPVAGISQLELSQQWWQWALGQPAATNPLLDTTGAAANTHNDGPVSLVAVGTAGAWSGRTSRLSRARSVVRQVHRPGRQEYRMPGIAPLSTHPAQGQ